MKVLFLSTYDLGHQPFAIASPVAWLREKGHKVACLDLAVVPFDSDVIAEAEFIAISLPMHTATRLAARILPDLRRQNSKARICCYGLYAPLNAEYLRNLGADVILGGEFEAALVQAIQTGDTPESTVSHERLEFRTPDRRGLPSLSQYPHLHAGKESKIVGYTEASRGCKHLCSHCPIVPVYNGTFRVVPPEVVLADIRQQVAAGAQHITFGDPDFFNGPGHARRIVAALHDEFPTLSYDVTIKIEHLLKHTDLLPVLRTTGCLFITSAVESVQDEVLTELAKGHTRADFIEAVRLVRAHGLTLAPTFVPFTPWTTIEGYRDLLETLVGLDLVDSVAPVQLGLRLLLPAGSPLLNTVPTTGFDPAALVYRWKHSDPAVDDLACAVMEVVKRSGNRREIFRDVWQLAHGAPMHEPFDLMPRATIPYMDEPWYC